MRRHLAALLADPAAASAMAERGRRGVLARHTCAHRVDELLDIVRQLDTNDRQPLAQEAR
jgi:spore maturation protein CgeB